MNKRGIQGAPTRKQRMAAFLACCGVSALFAYYGPGQAARAEAALRLEGTFVQNAPCRGDGTDPKPRVVRITPDEIAYSGGVCSIANRRQEKDHVRIHVTCHTRAGKVLSGNIVFAQGEGDTMTMVDQERTYRAVLNRCPERLQGQADSQPR